MTQIPGSSPLPAVLPRRRVYAVLALGVLAVSFSAIFVRWCEAPALAIAFYRLFFASAFLILSTRGKAWRARQTLSLPAAAWAVLSGVMLAGHFVTWIASLSHTSVASSTVLVATLPVFVTLGAVFVLRERLRPLLAGGLLLAMIGVLIIALCDGQAGRDSLRGDLLALAGALFGSVYFLIGRRLRQSMPTRVYVTLCYSTAALVVLLAALLLRVPLLSYSWQTFGLFMLIALVPQIMGHTSFNWALRHLSAPTVAVALLGEPVGASLLAWLLLGEKVAGWTMLGGLLTLAGVTLAIYGEPRS
ncbi:MAG: DMT family transporter [candidate division KSB1 bacterium]|nr:DMT family transporter [candidate division KSB1 bacterium]MDZ7275326.1 DMT family transporter [candidate division KSB1 bacterium]MDZ7287493.1 DMT family transporter [candidate division KSB1 bacterium]MDZ7299607.1 DMT family transporter [candidate division KSB1 bacterium]MDZ7307455.1 DMT family transporter [candidate division KSB1 bacterium]